MKRYVKALVLIHTTPNPHELNHLQQSNIQDKQVVAQEEQAPGLPECPGGDGGIHSLGKGWGKGGGKGGKGGTSGKGAGAATVHV